MSGMVCWAATCYPIPACTPSYMYCLWGLAGTASCMYRLFVPQAGAIEKYEVEIKRRNDEIEKKTREIDLLNRK